MPHPAKIRGSRARSSAGEHTLHTGGVVGSIPTAPTTGPPNADGGDMPEGITVATREDDPFAWALTLASKVRQRQGALTALDRESLSDFLEEWATEMLATARTKIVDLMPRAAKGTCPR